MSILEPEATLIGFLSLTFEMLYFWLMKLNLITVMSLKGFQGLRMAIILSVVQFKSPINGTNLLLYNSRSICISNEIALSRGMH